MATEALVRLGVGQVLVRIDDRFDPRLLSLDFAAHVGGIAHTRGGLGERIERIRRDVKGVAIPGGSEEICAFKRAVNPPRRSFASAWDKFWFA
jgi:hypothetical protein